MDRPARGRARRRRSGQLRRHQRDPRIRRQPYTSGVRGRTVGRVRGADERPALRGGRHRVDGGRHASGRRRHASRTGPAARRRAVACRRHHFRMQERLWADGRGRGPLAADRRGRHRRDDVSWRPRRSRGVPRRPRRRTSTWSAVRCCRPARRTPGGWMCSATAAPSMSTRPVTSSQPEWPPGSIARLHAGQLGPSAGIRLAVELGAASVDHCTYATDDDVEALAGAADTTVATLLPGAEFSTRARYPDGDGSSTRARPSRWRPTAIPAVRSRQACRSASRSRCGT